MCGLRPKIEDRRPKPLPLQTASGVTFRKVAVSPLATKARVGVSWKGSALRRKPASLFRGTLWGRLGVVRHCRYLPLPPTKSNASAPRHVNFVYTLDITFTYEARAFRGVWYDCHSPYTSQRPAGRPTRRMRPIDWGRLAMQPRPSLPHVSLRRSRP